MPGPWTATHLTIASVLLLETRGNIEVASIPSIVHNAKGMGDQVGLDLTGFALVLSPSTEKLFEDGKAIRGGYYEEVEKLVKKRSRGCDEGIHC
jgi:hypothetical protein